MTVETKAELMERLLSMEKPKCPHCEQEMSLWEVPDIAVGDGLGWGTPYLFICFNDDCPMYKQGWEDLMDSVAQNASYRCMNYPGTDQFECLPVFSPEGGKGQVIDDEIIAEQERFKEAMKRGFQILAECYVNKDHVTMLTMLVDATEPIRVRLKAAEMLGDFADTEAIEPLRYHKFPNDKLVAAVEEAIEKIHKRHFTAECPYCAEIIKQRAKVCKHCGKEL